MLTSARSAITVTLRPVLWLPPELLPQGVHFRTAAPEDFFDDGWRRTIRIALANAPILFHDSLVIVRDKLLDNADIFVSQDRHDRADLVIGAVLLEIGNQILHSDSTV